MWLEYLNTKCDKRTKELICNEHREVVLFPFSLQSSYATSSISNLTLNTKDNILISILLTAAKIYLQKKLQSKSAFELIDWQTRIQAIKLLSSVVKIWLSKIFTNFMDTSHLLYQQRKLKS